MVVEERAVMTPWKLIAMVFVLLLPGGSLVLLALATAKALGDGKLHLFQRNSPAPAPAVVVSGGKA
jgi:hypothetical protein